MAYELNQFIIGKVTKIKPFAAFLSFEDGTEGLLHISEISDSYIRDIEKFVTIGDEVKVKVLAIDSSNGFLRVSLKQVPHEESYSTHINVKKKTIQEDKNGFLVLKEKLPIWIEETLKRKEEENND
jgi:predicted RNA-binding protein with RPS1 domain